MANTSRPRPRPGDAPGGALAHGTRTSRQTTWAAQHNQNEASFAGTVGSRTGAPDKGAIDKVTGSAAPRVRTGQPESHARRLLAQGDELANWLKDLREAQAPGETVRAESRVRDALPVVRGAIDLSVTGLDKLSRGRIVHAYEYAQWIDALTTVEHLEWESLLSGQAQDQDKLAASAVSDLRSRLDQLADSATLSPLGVEQVRADLMQLRAQVVAAERETGEPLSTAWLTRVLVAMARIAKTIAVGLLAAAATAGTQGGQIASQILTAAVGLAVSAILAEAGRAVRSLWHAPTVATRLESAHHDLLDAIEDLGYFLRRLVPASSPTEHDVLLVRETQFAALASTYYAKRLAGALNWPAAADYYDCLNEISDLLGQVAGEFDSGDRASTLATSLSEVIPKLAGFSIPANAPIHNLAPESLRGRRDHPPQERE